jgi:sugar/nucleoside kinase (ribokinase family)
VLVDISDCSRRSPRDILEMLELLARFKSYFKTIFSLNLNEAQVICASLKHCGENTGNSNAEYCIPGFKDAAELIYRHTALDLIVLHLADGAYIIDKEGGRFISGRRVERPALSTGGGDNFNAGLLWALLHGLPAGDAVLIANTVGSLYVEEGKSPTAAAVLRNLPAEPAEKLQKKLKEQQ